MTADSNFYTAAASVAEADSSPHSDGLVAQLTLQYQVASLLLRDRTTDEGLLSVVGTIAASLGWDAGVVWLTDGERLAYQCEWHRADVDAAAFVVQSHAAEFTIGANALGNALDAGTAVWVDDIAADSQYPRRSVALAAGFSSAMLFPLYSGQTLYGAIELLRCAAAPCSAQAPALFTALSTDIGQFLQARQFEAKLWARHAQPAQATGAANAVVANQAEALALHDSLTGLAGQTLFIDRGNQALLRAERNGQGVAVLFADLDAFHSVRETFGPTTCSNLLKLVAERFGVCIRSSDTLTRLDCDEFIVLLPDLKASEDALVIVKNIVAQLAAPFFIDDVRLDISASIGVARYPQDGFDMSALLTCAEEVLNEVKQSGGNGYRIGREYTAI